MSFPRAGLKRFNDVQGCAPPVGAYDPKADTHAVAVGFDKTDRFKAPKDIGTMPNASFNISNVSAISCQGLSPSKRLSQFSTSTPNLSIQQKKAKQSEGKKASHVDNGQVKQLEREIKKLLQERVEQDRLVSRKEDELRKIDGKLHHAMSEKSSLQAKLASLEKQLTDLQKANDVLKNKIVTAECSLKKQENLQAEVNSLKAQITVKEGEATRLRQDLDTAVSDLLGCLYTSLATATALSDKGQQAGNLEELRANNLGIIEKLKLANMKVKMLRDEVGRVVEDVRGEARESREEWEDKYNVLNTEKDRLAATVHSTQESLAQSEAARQALQTDSDALSTQVETMKITITEMEAERNTNLEKISNLKELLTAEKSSRKAESQTAFESSAEKAELHEKIEHLEENNAVLNTNIRLMTEKYHCLEIALAEEQSTNEGHVTKLEAQLNLCQADTERLQGEVLSLQEKNRDFITTLHEERTISSQKINNLQEELKDRCDNSATQIDEIDRLNSQIKELQADIVVYKQQIQEGHCRESELKQTIAVLEKQVVDLQAEITALQQGAVLAREELQEKLEQVKLQHETLQQQYSSHVNESAERMSELESRLEAEGGEKAALLTQINTLRLDVTQLSVDGEAFSQLRMDFDRYKEEVSEKEKEMKRDLDEVMQSKASVDRNCRELEEKMNELSLKGEQERSERDELVAEVDQVKGHADHLSEANLQLTKKLCECEETRDRFRSENSELEQELEKAKNHREALLIENEELEEKLSGLKEEASELKSQRDDLAEKLEDLSVEKCSLEEKCSQMEAILEDQTTDQEDLETAQKNLQAELVKSLEVKQAISDKFVQIEAQLGQAEKKLAEVQSQEAAAQKALEESNAERTCQAEKIARLEQQLSDMRTEMSKLNVDNQDLQTKLQVARSDTLKTSEELDNLKNSVKSNDVDRHRIEAENAVLRQDLDSSEKENLALTSRSLQLEEIVQKLKSEKEELLSERDQMRSELTAVIEEIQNMKEAYSSVENSNTCTSAEKEALTAENISLEKQLQERTAEVKLHLEHCDQMEQRLIESERQREEITASITQLEVGFEHRLGEEQQKFEQIREQYEQQLGVLREQLDGGIPRNEFDMLQVEAEKWKMKYEDLLLKVEPFLEQINAFEAEKEALLGRNKDAQNEVEKLSSDYAKLLGHQNQKQKIKHILKLKDENNSLKMELAKAREQLGKSKRTIQRLEERFQHQEGKKGRFDPSKAFQHSKENLPATPPSQKHTADPALNRPRPSPLANRNARYYSPIHNGLGQRL